MKKISIDSNKKKEIIDITELINKIISEENINKGICVLNILHTTTALTIADLDPGTDLDMLDAFNEIIPKLKYRHPHDPSHVQDHILSAIIGTSLTLSVNDNSIILGTWQRVILCEFDGPQKRIINCTFIKK